MLSGIDTVSIIRRKGTIMQALNDFLNFAFRLIHITVVVVGGLILTGLLLLLFMVVGYSLINWLI